MSDRPPADAPQFVAWVDTDGEGDQVHLRVTEDGQEYERVDSNLELLLNNGRYAEQFERAALALASLYQRARQQGAEGEESDDDPEEELAPAPEAE